MTQTSITLNQIMDLAAQEVMPITKKRGIVREYLQTKFITYLYQIPLADKMSFVGGTSLRMLRNMNRFSEDLDFDNLGLSKAWITDLIEAVLDRFKKENIEVELSQKMSEYKNYFELRFPHLLNLLGISSNPKEKLMIKVDYSNHWTGQTPEVVLLERFGMLEQVVTNPLNQLLVQKLAAYTERSLLQPRDMYDVVWLYANKARLDKQFMQANKLNGLVKKAQQRLAKQPVNAQIKNKLAPFLFNEADVSKLDLFDKVLEALGHN